MKQNFSVFAVFLTAFLSLLVISARAQENHPETADELKELNTNHPELKLEEDKTLLAEPDTKTLITPAAIIRENQSTKAGKPKDAKLEKEEDDALSFNFLFYIFEKFKKSDIVDN